MLITLGYQHYFDAFVFTLQVRRMGKVSTLGQDLVQMITCQAVPHSCLLKRANKMEGFLRDSLAI